MEFEDVLKKVGDFGRFQKTLVCIFLIPALTVAPMFSMNLIFLSSTPDHWCYVPDVESSDLSRQDKLSLVRPKSDPFCSTYDVNFSAVISSGNLTPSDEWPTVSCSNGWVYDTVDYDDTATTRWNMVCSRAHYATLVVSLLFVGDIIGTIAFGILPEKIGRKRSVIFLAFFTGITEITSVFVPNFTAFLVLRLFNGATINPLYVSCYISMLEVVGTNYRTSMNAVAVGSWSLGLCILPLLAWGTRSWIRLSMVCSSSAFAFLIYLKLLPESPRWLLTQDRHEEARDIMMKISKENSKSVNPEQLLHDLQTIGSHMKKRKEGQEKHTPLDLLKYPKLRKTFLLVTICFIGNSLTYFGLQVNVKNLFGSQFINFFLLSVVEFPSHAVTWFFMEKFGRRWSSVGALSLTGLACLIPVILPTEMETVGVIASLFAKLGASSAYMTLYQQSPELYPTPLRGVGMSMSATIGTATTLAVPYVADLALYGKHFPFMLFSCTSLCAAACASFLPETLNMKLPQSIEDAEKFTTDQKFFSCARKGSDVSRQESHSVAPSIQEIALGDIPEAVSTTADNNCSSAVRNAEFPPTETTANSIP